MKTRRRSPEQLHDFLFTLDSHISRAIQTKRTIQRPSQEFKCFLPRVIMSTFVSSFSRQNNNNNNTMRHQKCFHSLFTPVCSNNSSDFIWTRRRNRMRSELVTNAQYAPEYICARTRDLVSSFSIFIVFESVCKVCVRGFTVHHGRLIAKKSWVPSPHVTIQVLLCKVWIISYSVDVGFTPGALVCSI